MKRRSFLGKVVSAAGIGKVWPAGTVLLPSVSLRSTGVDPPMHSPKGGEGEADIWLKDDLNSSLPKGSEQRGGDWRAHEGCLTQGQYGGPFMLVMGEPEWNDYTARVSVRFEAPDKGTEAGLALHVRGPGDYVVFSLKNKKGGLFAVLCIETAAGIFFPVNAPYLSGVRRNSAVGDQSLLRADPQIWHELRVDVHGTEFNGYVDGLPVAGFDSNAQPPRWYAHQEPHWSPNPTEGRVGLFTLGWPSEFRQLEVRRLRDFSHIATPTSGRRDAAGRLLPRLLYGEAMQRNTQWVLRCDEVVEKDMAPPSLRHLDPVVLAIWVGSDDERLNYDVGEYAFNAGTFLSGAVQYYLYSGDTRILAKAEALADWGLANSTPGDWALPHLAPSIVQWLPDGSWRGMPETWGLEPDKSAYLGDAYLRLYMATEKSVYLEGARRIADTLLKLRQPDGHWPFRVVARTGQINYQYTHSQLWYVRFFERLARITGEKSWLAMRDGAFRWLMENPVKTNLWEGLYGDIGSGAKSYDQWVPLEFAQYLVDHRAEDPAYLGVALKIVDWVYQNMVVPSALHAGVPGVVEQTGYKVVLAHHELRLAQTHAVLWGAIRDTQHRQAALDIANSVTWLLMSDGKMRMSHWSHSTDCYLRCLTFNDQFTRIMAEIPQSAPQDEDHLLQTSSDVRRIRYAVDRICYETVGPSSEVLVTRAAPRRVKVGDAELPRKTESTLSWGWIYDPETHRLDIHHERPDVEILL